MCQNRLGERLVGHNHQQLRNAMQPAAQEVLTMLIAEGMKYISGAGSWFSFGTHPSYCQRKDRRIHFWPDPVRLFLCCKDTVNYSGAKELVFTTVWHQCKVVIGLDNCTGFD